MSLLDLPNTKIIADDICIIGGSNAQKRILDYKTVMEDILKRLQKQFKAGKKTRDFKSCEFLLDFSGSVTKFNSMRKPS